jgi:hypothetical protein
LRALEPENLAANWRAEAPILCIAGRGPLDEFASLMLGQLLGKHGLGTRLIPFSAVSRAEIASLNVQGVAMVCIIYLEMTGSPSHLRYLLRRLRARLPEIPTLVGLWLAEDAIRTDDRLQATIGVDHYASSLREAVQSCLTTAQASAKQAQKGCSIQDARPSLSVIESGK